MAQKLQSSLAVEGELSEDGLAAYGDDLMLALARKIVAGEEDAGSVESIVELARQVVGEAPLADEGWAGPEPEAVAVGATVATESVTDASDTELHRSLFSWAEFMVGEQNEPPGRRWRDEAPTLSLRWALEQEQQEGALTGAAR